MQNCRPLTVILSGGKDRRSFVFSALPTLILRMRVVRLFILVALAALSRAEDSPAPTPYPAAPRKVTLRFVPPPLEGTISLGIFDRTGKLVRVLHREDAIADFTAGHDGLETTWDGKDDAGNSVADGKYRARGYLVGDLKIEGVDYFFNDWVTDEKSPHIAHLWQPWMEEGELRVNADLPGGKKASFICDQVTGAISREVPLRWGLHCDDGPKPTSIVSPRDCAAGKDATTWFIDANNGSGPAEVKQLGKDGVLLRRLAYTKDDPQPESIEASTKEDKIFLLEQNERGQRLRALTLIRTAADQVEGSVSDWKTDFEKKITAHKDFSIEDGKPVAASPNEHVARQKIAQALRANPLKRDEVESVDLAAGFDADGGFLKTADGLPLRTISETGNLCRTLLAPDGGNAIDVFEDDGAVVEQFRVSALDQMMAFDCGDFELK
jgi:hypothetical protein